MSNITRVMQFSGGRTSGYMLRKFLDEHGGKLPADTVVCFENTGKEREETLDFIHEVETRWQVPIYWLEFDDYFDKAEYLTPDGEILSRKKRSGVRFKIVNYETAARKGEPFEKLLRMIAEMRKFVKDEPPLLPNVAQRICTDRLKVKVLQSFLRQHLHLDEWECYIGIRKDEEHRLAKMRLWSPSAETLVAPLVENGTTKIDVKTFWSNSEFDLKLDPESDEGNCDLCFLKAVGKLVRIMEANREREKWWIGVEELTGTTFSRTKPSFKQLAQMIDNKDPKLDKWRKSDADKTIDCFCGD